jgi:transposase-like protein
MWSHYAEKHKGICLGFNVEDPMKRSKYSDERILAIVKEGDAGRKVADLCRMHGITEQTYYRWKAKYGGMELSEVQLEAARRCA